MTDFELMSVYTEYTQIFVTMVSVYVSLLFAYLVAMYLVASRLSTIQFWTVTAFFGLTSFDILSGVRIHGARAANLEAEIARRVEAPESSLGFIQSDGIAQWVPFGLFGVYIAITVIAVIFAVQIRRGREAPES